MVQACATGSGEVFLQPIERGEEQGPDTAKKVAAKMGLASDTALDTCLQRVGSRIAAANPDRPIPP